jgi:hypothetical protein
MQLIVIAGQAGVGKTSLARIITKKAYELGLTPKLLSFATPLKEMAESRGMGKKDNPDKYRRFCQRVGARMRRRDPDYWVNQFEESLIAIRDEELNNKTNKYWERCVIVDDCRYLNEVKLTHKYAGTLVFVSYGDREIPTNSWRDHESEELAKIIDAGPSEYRQMFSCILKNQDDEKSLERKVNVMVPIWCGVQPSNGSVIVEYDEHIDDLTTCIEELIDLLLLNSENEEEEEEDEDEETEESDDRW